MTILLALPTERGGWKKKLPRLRIVGEGIVIKEQVERNNGKLLAGDYEQEHSSPDSEEGHEIRGWHYPWCQASECTAQSSKPWLHCSDVTSSMKHPILLGGSCSPIAPYVDQRSVSSSAAAASTMRLGRGQGWYSAEQNPGEVPAGEVDQTLERVSLEQKPVPDWAKD